MSLYASEYPSLNFSADFKEFFEDFYAITDDPEAHAKYVDQFTDDATLIMASKTAMGSSEILALRKSLWDKVKSRRHRAFKVFPFGNSASEAMLYGTAEYVLKSGDLATTDWAARATLVKQGEVVKLRHYQVYLDTAPQLAWK